MSTDESGLHKSQDDRGPGLLSFRQPHPRPATHILEAMASSMPLSAGGPLLLVSGPG